MALSACRKPEDNIGLDLIPGDAQLGTLTTDTATIVAYTLTDTAVRTSGLTRNVLGSYVDRQFGTLTCGMAVHLRLTSNNVTSAHNSALVPDSLVLSLVYDGGAPLYGNAHPQVFVVRELAERLSTDSTFHSDDRPATIGTDLSWAPGASITPQPLVKPIIDGDTLAAQLRIRLSDELAQRLLSAWGTNDLADNDKFLDFFHGLAISAKDETVPGKGGLLNFLLEGGLSRMTLYYRDNTPGSEDTLSYDFAINSNSLRYTFVERDFSTATDLRLQNCLQDSTLGNAVNFLQTFGGTRVALRLPHVARFPEAGLDALAKAELIIPIAEDYPVELPPQQLNFVFRKNDAGQDVNLPDFASGIGQYGGVFNSTNKEYRFNITRYMQGLLTGEYENTGIDLIAGFNGVTGNRAVLAGPGHSDRPMQLRLTFTAH
ncbi:MAG: DUF4270 family protein [Flavobacteriales bacterium]|nr:MAG: DUF4270 family protein [Flavobacteriales bacterium]